MAGYAADVSGAQCHDFLGELPRASATRAATSDMSTGVSSVSMKRLSSGIIAVVRGLNESRVIFQSASEKLSA